MDKVIISRVEEIAKKRGKTMTQVALAWVGPKVTSHIIGFSSVKRLEEAVDNTGFELSEEETKYLEEPLVFISFFRRVLMPYRYVPKPVRGHA